MAPEPCLISIIYVLKDEDGVTSFQSSSTDKLSAAEDRTVIKLAVIRTNFGQSPDTIRGVSNLRTPLTSPVLTTKDFNFPQFIVTEGAEIQEFDPSVDITMSNTAGKIAAFGLNFSTSMDSPNVLSLGASPAEISFIQLTTTGETTGTDDTLMDTLNFDDGTGSLTLIANNQYSAKRLWCDPANDQYYLQYGLDQYTSAQIAAEEFTEENPIAPAILGEFAFVIATIIIQQGTTTWDTGVLSEILQGDRTGGTVTSAGGGGGNADTPWTVNHDAAGFELTNLSKLQVLILELENTGTGANPVLEADIGTGRVLHIHGNVRFDEGTELIFDTNVGIIAFREEGNAFLMEWNQETVYTFAETFFEITNTLGSGVSPRLSAEPDVGNAILATSGNFLFNNDFNLFWKNQADDARIGFIVNTADEMAVTFDGTELFKFSETEFQLINQLAGGNPTLSALQSATRQALQLDGEFEIINASGTNPVLSAIDSASRQAILLDAELDVDKITETSGATVPVNGYINMLHPSQFQWRNFADDANVALRIESSTDRLEYRQTGISIFLDPTNREIVFGSGGSVGVLKDDNTNETITFTKNSKTFDLAKSSTVFLNCNNTDDVANNDFFALSGPPAGGQVYDNRAVAVAVDTTFSKMNVTITTNNAGVPVTFTFALSPTITGNQSVIVPAGSTGTFIDNTNTDVVVFGGTVAYQAPATIGGVTLGSIGVLATTEEIQL